MKKIITTVKTPDAEEMTLNELAWNAHANNIMLYRCDNYLVATNLEREIFFDEDNDCYDEFVSFFFLQYYSITGNLKNQRARFVEYDFIQDKAKMTNGVMENLMDRDTKDYIPIIMPPSTIKKYILSAIREQEINTQVKEG